MLPRNHPDRIRIAFDDRRLVANAGLLLPATLARHLGLPELVQQRLDLGDAPLSLLRLPAFSLTGLSSRSMVLALAENSRSRTPGFKSR